MVTFVIVTQIVERANCSQKKQTLQWLLCYYCKKLRKGFIKGFLRMRTFSKNKRRSVGQYPHKTNIKVNCSRKLRMKRFFLNIK